MFNRVFIVSCRWLVSCRQGFE